MHRQTHGTQNACDFLPRPTLSVGVGRMFESVCLFVCLEYNSKTNDPKVFKLGIGNDFGISRTDMVLGFQGHGLGLWLGYSNTTWVQIL